MAEASCCSMLHRAGSFFSTSEIRLLGGQCLIRQGFFFFFLPHSYSHSFSWYISFFPTTWRREGKKRSSFYPTSSPCLIILYRTALALIPGLKGWIFINCWGYNHGALHPFLLPLSPRRGKQWNILAIRAESLSMQPSNCHLPPAQIASPLLPSPPPPGLTWQNSQKLLQNWRQLPLCM